MKTLNLIFVCAVSILLTSCLRRAYFLNPFHGNNQPYRTTPMVSDSSHNGTYVSGSISAGGANDQLADGVFTFQGSFYQAHTFRNFQLYYGVTGTLGNYHINTDHHYDDLPNSNYLNTIDGDKFFGGAGGIGGFSFVLPFENGNEWRVLGLEGNVQKEFGDYQDIRFAIPDSSAHAVDRNDLHGSIAFSTNFIKKFRKSGNAFGYKLAYVTSTNPVREDRYGLRRHSLRPGFISNTFHLTAKRITGFAQFNFGNYVANMQVGMNYRLF